MSSLTTPTQRRPFLVASAPLLQCSSPGAGAAPRPRLATTEAPLPGDEWVARINGKHKQVFDCTTSNMGFGAAFGLNFIDSMKEAQKLTDKDVTAVVVFRHISMPLMLNDSMWAKYKIGEMLDVKDPKTNAPATRNIFRDNVPSVRG